MKKAAIILAIVVIIILAVIYWGRRNGKPNITVLGIDYGTKAVTYQVTRWGAHLTDGKLTVGGLDASGIVFGGGYAFKAYIQGNKAVLTLADKDGVVYQDASVTF